jgi:hypothetical protein
VPFEQLDLLVNGEVQASKAPSGDQLSAVVETDLVCQQSAWVAATCHGPARLASGACVFAHTTPVYLDVRDRPIRPGADNLAPLLLALERTRTWVVEQASCESDRQRAHLLGVLDAARTQVTGARA